MDYKEMKVLIFSLNGEHYATDIREVERILGYLQPTEIPDVPNFVEGVINYEEKILPIINLSKKFKFSSLKEQSDLGEKKIIVIKRKDNKFGIIVDTVYEVCDITSDLLEEPPAITGVDKNYLKGLIKLEEKIVILLDIDKILSEEDEGLIF